MTIKQSEVKIPTFTAVFADFFPSISLKISVVKKVDANNIFPSVCSIPKASTKIITSIFAAIVANTVQQYNPFFPNKQYHNNTIP